MRNNALAVLRAASPRYVLVFTEEWSRTHDRQKARKAVEGIHLSKQFDKWIDIWIAFLDVELAFHQTKLSLRLLAADPTSSVDRGEWVNYHMDAWLFWTNSLLERYKKLVSKLVRQFVRPANAQWQQVEDQLLKRINHMEQEVGKLRNPRAHGGGVFEGPFTKERLIGGILAGSSVDAHLFENAARLQGLGYVGFNKCLEDAMKEMDAVSEQLDTLVDWNFAQSI